MIITCKACNTRFNLDESAINPAGSKVRCSVCSNVFTAYPDSKKASLPDDEPDDEMDWKAVAASDADAPDDEKDADPFSDLDLSLSDSDLEIETEDDPETAETRVDDLDDSALMMEISGILDETTDDATVIVSMEEDSFDLDTEGLDFSLDDGSNEDAQASDPASDDDDMDFALEIDDGSDDGSDDESTIIISDLEDNDELDLDLALEKETTDETAAASDHDAAPSDLDEISLELEGADDGLSLTLELDDGEPEAASAPPSKPVLSDDLDLSGLDDLLNDSHEKTENATTVILGEEDPELSLDLADDGPPEMTTDEKNRKGETATGDDLDLGLDLELEEKNVASEDTSLFDDGAEIDLTEIEQMLDQPDAMTKSFTPSIDQDLDLDIEASLDTEKWTSSSKAETVVVDEEIDLTEFEEILDEVDTEEKDNTTEEQELELDLGDTVASETVAVDNDLDFDLSDFDDSAASGTSARDIEQAAERHQKPRHPVEPTLEDEDLEATITIPSQSTPASTPSEAVHPALSGDETKKSKGVAVKKSGSGKKWVLILLILILLLGAAGGAWYFLTQSGIEIPIIGKYLKSEVSDSGLMKLTTENISNQYVENSSVGRLFVVSGTVKNGYTENRGMIHLQGKLFSKGKMLQKQAVYAANIMSDLELANLEWDKIKNRMENRLGDNQRNVKIEPGKEVPFMIVFSNLQDNPDEFTVEVIAAASLR